MESKLFTTGTLTMTKFKTNRSAPLSWKLQNFLKPDHIWGWLVYHAAGVFTKVTHIPTLRGMLSIRLLPAQGGSVDYGVVSHRLVTDAFVALMVDQLQTETSVWGDFKYHDSGIGTTAADNNDTAMETTDGEDRVAGNQGEGASAWIYKSVGTIAYTTSKAITEHGLFNHATDPTLMDRHVFAAVNVVNGDSIEFTYQLTCTAET